MRRSIELRTIVLVVIAIACGSFTSRVLIAAQQTGSTDVLAALLTEVKGLRAAIEQMSSSSGRIQLSVARLQIEEQRIAEQGKRLQDVRQRLGDSRRKLQETEDNAAQIESQLTSGNVKEDERQHLSAVEREMKREAAGLRAIVSELTGEESQMTQDIATEQARWLDISRRLDELDAAMASRK